MSTKYKATDSSSAYFITITTVGWVDIFTRLNQKNVIIDALRYCQKHKGLEIYAYVLMHSHLHLLCKSVGSLTLAEIMRDFKKHTSKKIIETIINESRSRGFNFVQSAKASSVIRALNNNNRAGYKVSSLFFKANKKVYLVKG